MQIDLSFSRALVATSLIVGLSAGCAGAQSPFNLFSGSQNASWTDVLQSLSRTPPQQSAADLRAFRSRFGVSSQEKQEAAYLLARLIQANPSLSLPQTQPQPAQTPAGVSTALDEAMSLYKESAALSSLHQLALTHELECAAGNEEATRAILQQQIADTKDPKKIAPAKYALAQSFMKDQNVEAAMPLFFEIRTILPDSNVSYGAGYYIADAALNGQAGTMTAAEAIDSFRAYLKHNPDGRFAKVIVSRLNDMATKSNLSVAYSLTPADHELFGQVYFVSGDYRNALSEWEKAPAYTKGSQRATCLAKLGKVADARQTLIEAIKADPETSYAGAATVISDYLDREHTKQFWAEILTAKPQKADTALWNIGIRSEAPESLNAFKKLIATYPTSEFAPESAWWQFWYYAKKAHGDPAAITAALPIAHDAITKYPETRAAERLAFWLGKLHELAKKPGEAAVDYRYLAGHYPSSYYGHRALARLAAIGSPRATNSGEASGAPRKARDVGWTTYPARTDAKTEWSWPSPDTILTRKEITERYGATVAELFKLKQYDECVDSLPAEYAPEFKSALLAKMDKPLPAINAAKPGLTGQPHHNAHWQLCYPLMYAGNVKAEANSKNVDPYLVHALIREESHYNHLAISRSKALGLMQLLPGTGYGVAKRLGVAISSQDDFFKPEINIKLGTDYLAYVLGRYGGSALFAVASYNGGPNAVKSWLRAHEETGTGDLDYFVENIPVRETRDYVRKVFGAYWNYLDIYGAYPSHQVPG